MKIQFKDIGPKKFNKVVELNNLIGHDLMEFICNEADLHMPEQGDCELVPIDGRDSPISNKFAIVHEDASHVTRGMGTIIISHY